MQRAAVILAACALAACSGQQQQEAQKGGDDAYLVTAVTTKLLTIDVDASTGVHVAANNGVVTLSGLAHTPQERSQYDAAARSISGVRSVDDKLTVGGNFRGVRATAADAALTARVSAAIAAQAGANVFHVKPSVRNGTVTLTGTVNDPSVKQTIVHTVKGVPGVHAVIDRINAR